MYILIIRVKKGKGTGKGLREGQNWKKDELSRKSLKGFFLSYLYGGSIINLLENSKKIQREERGRWERQTGTKTDPCMKKSSKPSLPKLPSSSSILARQLHNQNKILLASKAALEKAEIVVKGKKGMTSRAIRRPSAPSQSCPLLWRESDNCQPVHAQIMMIGFESAIQSRTSSARIFPLGLHFSRQKVIHSFQRLS